MISAPPNHERRFRRPNHASAPTCRRAEAICPVCLKQPYAIVMADDALMVMAGLWASWNSPAVPPIAPESLR